MTPSRELLEAALVWRDMARIARDPAFRKLWRRNMRDCALAWREAILTEGEP